MDADMELEVMTVAVDVATGEDEAAAAPVAVEPPFVPGGVLTAPGAQVAAEGRLAS